MSIPYKLLSFIEDGKIVSSNLFQDLQAPRYNCDFLVVINDKVGLFSKEGYRVKPTYDSGYSDNCHYSFILVQDGKKRYWDVDYKTYKITEGQYDFHIKYYYCPLKVYSIVSIPSGMETLVRALLFLKASPPIILTATPEISAGITTSAASPS